MPNDDTPIFWETVEKLGPVPRAVNMGPNPIRERVERVEIEGEPPETLDGLVGRTATVTLSSSSSPAEEPAQAGEATTAPARPATVKVKSRRLPACDCPGPAHGDAHRPGCPRRRSAR